MINIGRIENKAVKLAISHYLADSVALIDEDDPEGQHMEELADAFLYGWFHQTPEWLQSHVDYVTRELDPDYKEYLRLKEKFEK